MFKTTSIALVALSLVACGSSDLAEVDASTGGSSSIEATGGSSSVTTVESTGGSSSTGGATSDPCGCTIFEDHPSSTAIYIKTCGDRAQYVEHSVGIPSEVSVCVYLTDAGQ